MYRMKSGEVVIAPVHDVNGSCLYHELTEDIYFVDRVMGDDWWGCPL